jgi:RNA-directed DNA polymerase
MTGYFAYFAVPTNTYLLSAFRYHTSIIWFRSLRRRGQRHRLTWEQMIRLIKRFLPSPRVLHPWPNHRFHVKHSRHEPGALAAPAGICAGARRNPRPYRGHRRLGLHVHFGNVGHRDRRLLLA